MKKKPKPEPVKCLYHDPKGVECSCVKSAIDQEGVEARRRADEAAAYWLAKRDGYAISR